MPFVVRSVAFKMSPITPRCMNLRNCGSGDFIVNIIKHIWRASTYIGQVQMLLLKICFVRTVLNFNVLIASRLIRVSIIFHRILSSISCMVNAIPKVCTWGFNLWQPSLLENWIVISFKGRITVIYIEHVFFLEALFVDPICWSFSQEVQWIRLPIWLS